MTHSRATRLVPLTLSLLTMAACVEPGLDDGGPEAPLDPAAIADGATTPSAVRPSAPGPAVGGWELVPAASLTVTVASTPTAKVGLEGRKADRDAKCERRTIGACVIERCGAVPVEHLTAVPAVTVALGADEVAWLSDAQPTSELPPLAIGDTVKITSAGEVPASFGAAVPDDLALRTPAGPRLELGGAQQVVTWRPVADGVVSVRFASAVAPGFRRATCDFPAATGTGTIPAAVLAQFPPSGDAALTMSFMHQGLATGALDGLPVTLRLESRALVVPVSYR